jgi:hypothetical protein
MARSSIGQVNALTLSAWAFLSCLGRTLRCPDVSNEVRFATPYLQVETQSTALERAFERELAGAMLVAMTMERTWGDHPPKPFRPAL